MAIRPTKNYSRVVVGRRLTADIATKKREKIIGFGGLTADELGTMVAQPLKIIL